MTTSVGSVPATGPRRDPAVAGSFYPGVPEVLEAMVRDLFDEAAGLPRPAARPFETALPAGLLVPHAGLAFSGIVAAAAWATMRSTPRTPAK
ncbi:MAG TPA: AmmeMemoRadiSam system protein B, partial [Candidatus Limnocylindrales bacterium]|nr:AmmeMemoRadiSam system protein B [Candidatus Limnocylindrales bacterium]